jgi:hypothetical protein
MRRLAVRFQRGVVSIDFVVIEAIGIVFILDDVKAQAAGLVFFRGSASWRTASKYSATCSGFT